MDNDINMDALISAYADGELEGENLARAEAYLAEHPEVRKRLDAYRDMDATAAAPASVPHVSAEEWDRSWAHVQARTVGGLQAHRAGHAKPEIRTPKFSLMRWWLGAGAAAAAMVAIAIMVYMPKTPTGSGKIVEEQNKENVPSLADALDDDEHMVLDEESGSGLILPKKDMLPDYLPHSDINGGKG